MKKILLGVAGVRAEMRGGKTTESLFTGAAAGKIQFLHARSIHIQSKQGVVPVIRVNRSGLCGFRAIV